MDNKTYQRGIEGEDEFNDQESKHKMQEVKLLGSDMLNFLFTLELAVHPLGLEQQLSKIDENDFEWEQIGDFAY